MIVGGIKCNYPKNIHGLLIVRKHLLIKPLDPPSLVSFRDSSVDGSEVSGISVISSGL